MFDEASVCGRRAETVERRRKDGGNGAEAQRRRRAADGSPHVLCFQMSTNGQAGCDVGRSGISEGRSRHLRPACLGETDLFTAFSILQDRSPP
jgi:hypothetical protein